MLPRTFKEDLLKSCILLGLDVPYGKISPLASEISVNALSSTTILAASDSAKTMTYLLKLILSLMSSL